MYMIRFMQIRGWARIAFITQPIENYFPICNAIIKRSRQINHRYEQFTLPKIAKWMEIQANILTNALLVRDKSNNSRRTYPLIAFRYVHRDGLNATPPVSATDTTAVFAAYEISTTLPKRGCNLSAHTCWYIVSIRTHTSLLSNEFIWRPEWENYRHVARIRAVTTTEKMVHVRNLIITRTDTRILHIYIVVKMKFWLATDQSRDNPPSHLLDLIAIH